MSSMNERYESVVLSCFDELRGTFTLEQSFQIILGVSAIKWVNMKFSTLNLESESFLNEYHTLMDLHHALERFENRFSTFNGILTGIMDRIFFHKDKSAEEKILHIFQIIKSIKFSSHLEVRQFINKLTRIGAVLCGIYDTPESINKIIVGLLDLQNVKHFADYCSGTSGVALYIYEYLRSIQMERNVFYYGEEINNTIFLISKLLMIINEIENYEIVNKDVLMETRNDKDRKFDFVISDFPYLMSANIEFRVNDQRFKYGIPPRNSADWAFCQNVIYHLNNNGKGVVIGTKGTLVRSNEVNIRKGVLEDDLIEAVITLPMNLYGNTNIGTEILVFNKNKNKHRRNKVLFINAIEYSYRFNRNQHAITPEGIKKILECYKYGFEEEYFSKFVDLAKIREYNYTLNPKEYLDFDVIKNSFNHSVSLKEIAQITRGVQVSKEDIEELSKQPTHYFLNVKDIENVRINYDESSRLTNKKSDWIGKFDIKPNDIVLTSKGSTVKIAIVEDDYWPAFISGNLTRIRVNPRKYNAYILFEFLQSEVGNKMIEGIQTGTTIKLLNTSQLERLEIPMFDFEFMNEIGEEIKRNKAEYEETLKDAKQKFSKKREKIIATLEASGGYTQSK